tara:strand:+ start:3932 stop:4297 length:366 start_codon:yes stop_codon:yes gene_type:complete
MVKKKKGNKSVEVSVITALATIWKEVGMIGFVLIIMTFIFLFWGSGDQKREFIDIYILQKHNYHNIFPCTVVILFLFVSLILVVSFYSRMARTGKQERNRLGAIKTVDQSRALGKKLGSSK